MEKELKEREIITEEDIDKNNPAYFENNENNENENREFYVYEHIRLDNMTCFYVGKGKGERAYDLERNDFHDNISNSYGHVVVIVKDNLTEEEAFELEKNTIEDYIFTFGYGIDIDGYKNRENDEFLTNMTFGGEGVSGANKGKHLSEEHKKKLSESHKGKNNPFYGKHLSEEHKKKIGESNKGKLAGKNHPFYGKHLSEEHKKKMSKSLKGKNNPMYGKHHSEESKQKMSESSKGIQLSEETKLKISEAMKGKNNPFYGKHHSEESKQKMSESHKGKELSEEHKKNISKNNSRKQKVICITTGKVFNTINAASNYYKCSSISHCCRGIYKSSGKLSDGTPLKWKYVKDYNNDFKGILINPIIE